MWEGFVAKGLRRSWEMAPRGLDPRMIMNLRDVVERRLSKMSTQVEASLVDRAKKEVYQFETSLADRDKDKVRKEFCKCFWSWSVLVRKRFFWLFKRLVHEIRWHGKVKMEEIGFIDQIVESDTKLAE